MDLETKKVEKHLFEQMVGNYWPGAIYSQKLGFPHGFLINLYVKLKVFGFNFNFHQG